MVFVPTRVGTRQSPREWESTRVNHSLQGEDIMSVASRWNLRAENDCLFVIELLTQFHVQLEPSLPSGNSSIVLD